MASAARTTFWASWLAAPRAWTSVRAGSRAFWGERGQRARVLRRRAEPAPSQAAMGEAGGAEAACRVSEGAGRCVPPPFAFPRRPEARVGLA